MPHLIYTKASPTTSITASNRELKDYLKFCIQLKPSNRCNNEGIKVRRRRREETHIVRGSLNPNAPQRRWLF